MRDPNPASRMQSRLGQSYLNWLRLRRNPLAMIGLCITLVLLFAALFAPLLAPHDPITQDLGRRLLPPLTAETCWALTTLAAISYRASSMARAPRFISCCW